MRTFNIDHEVVETAAVLTLFNDFEGFAYKKDATDEPQVLDM
jgi:hypothetical protein